MPHPLNDYAARWEVDGDCIRCRRCQRTQQISWMLHDFHHQSGCRNSASERNPWLTLSSLITAVAIQPTKPEIEEVADG